MPDLERFISRIHAGSCRAEDFVKVLDGFEQIEYTMSLLSAFGGGEGIVDRLIAAMPDLKEPLKWWKTAFDHGKARENKLLVPERGVEEDFDESQDRIEELEGELDNLLQRKRRELGGNTSKIIYKNIGKEVYQLEVPVAIKVPKDWQMMSSASGFKRYYFPELKSLIRQLQEAQETHGQIVRQVASRFYARFDQDYTIWLQAVKVIAQLDCLISLAAASAALGEPSCRPNFVESERSIVEFEELRHPCMLPNVTDFIPNDVKLGGDAANINLLTGANAAGKSTILRMVNSLSHITSHDLTSRRPASPSSWLKLAAMSLASQQHSHPVTALCPASAPTTTSSQPKAPSSLSSPKPRRSSPKPRPAPLSF
jgi:DNA mismatch repair protein MSH6